MKKPSETDIERLKNQRRHNVQEQNVLTKNSILIEAKYWREKGLPVALLKTFEEKGINHKTSILIGYEQDYPGCSTDQGIILTADGHFFEFDADFNEGRTEVIELYRWTDVSEKYEVADQKKGIGKTFGFLAIEVLNELNDEIL